MKIVAVGDLMLGDSATAIGYGFASRWGDGPITPTFADLVPVFEGADLVHGNLEAVLGGEPFDPGNRHAAHLRGHASYAEALRDAGFDVISVANNHADQHGVDAFHATVEALEAAGVRCCGVRGDGVEWSSIPVVIQRGGRAIGFLGFSFRPPQYGNPVPPYAQGGVDELIRDVRALRAEVDHVVVSLHWGEEFVDRPSAEEVDAGRRLIEAGAAVVVGHHPHVVRPVERWRDGVIAYSLGNSVSDMVWQERLRRGLVVEVELDRHVGDVRYRRTRLSRDYALSLDGPWTPLGDVQVEGLAPDEYGRAAARSLARYRIAAYRHVLRMAPATPPGVLLQLVRDKVAGRIRSLGKGGTG